jgi:hypothetical protein
MPPDPSPPDPRDNRRSKHDLLRVLRRAGFAPEVIRDVDEQFPDTIDLERDADALAEYGITFTQLEDLLGGSP